MIKKLTAAALTLLFLAAPVRPARGADATRPSPEQVDALVQQLGAADHADREEAARRILEVGGPAVYALRKAAESDDPEIRMRARELLPRINTMAAAVIARDLQLAAAKALRIPVEQEIALGDDVKLTLVLVPAGEFEMGSKATPGRTTPVHKVKIADPYYIGKYPITQKQFQLVMGKNPSQQRGDDLPADHVSWDDALEFCKRLSKLTAVDFRLPSEAEWERACRAEARSTYYSGNDEAALKQVAWYLGNSEGKLHPVGRKKPNTFGIHDMLGSVWELCEDDWHPGYHGAPADGSAWVDVPRASSRVVRGGTWRLGPEIATSAHRSSCGATGDSTNWTGLRVVMSP